MMLPSVSTRISPEVYEKQRKIADTKEITLVEAMDDLIMGYEIKIKDLQKEIESLKAQIAQLTQKKERKPRNVHMIDPKKYLE